MPKYRAVPRPATPANTPAADVERHFRLESSKAVTTTWAWRAFLMMALVFIGFAINFGVQGKGTFLLVAWSLISAVWLAFSMYLWRMHTLWVRGDI